MYNADMLAKVITKRILRQSNVETSLLIFKNETNIKTLETVLKRIYPVKTKNVNDYLLFTKQARKYINQLKNLYRGVLR